VARRVTRLIGATPVTRAVTSCCVLRARARIGERVTKWNAESFDSLLSMSCHRLSSLEDASNVGQPEIVAIGHSANPLQIH
jgi:hypothetical protein